MIYRGKYLAGYRLLLELAAWSNLIVDCWNRRGVYENSSTAVRLEMQTEATLHRSKTRKSSGLLAQAGDSKCLVLEMGGPKGSWSLGKGRRARQLSELEASLVCIESSRSARATQ